MSAPDTNLDRQAKRHKGPLWGILTAVAVAGLLLLGYLLWIAEEGDAPYEDQGTAPASAPASE